MLTCAIGIATRGRAGMVTELLDALVHLERPSDFRLSFIFVENDTQLSLEELVKNFRERLASEERLIHVNEPKLGIPFARNRVIEIALEQGVDYLAFIDDDVRPDTNWLTELLGGACKRGLDLAGGPIRLGKPREHLDYWQRAVWHGVHFRMRRVERVAAMRQATGNDKRVTIITSNWLARMAFIRLHGMRFDESLGFSGGSDTLFNRQLAETGGRIGWITTATATETWSVDRLTLGYIFRRGCDQSMAYFRQRHPHGGVSAWLSTLTKVTIETVVALAWLVPALLGSGVAATACARSLGVAVGRMRGLVGAHSEHYRRTTGR